ncbi:MAG: glycosyltransferase family 2 protein [Bradyrhizobium sp.]|nr:MAG: glycosyltransferase family 2 protein [Bradyrhizobium sp.]
MSPAVSVIIPVYNAESHLTEALQSVLGQTYSDIEIICVDDCSTDRSTEIVDAFVNRDARVKFFRHSENRRGGGARNTGIRHATAERLAFVDADDRALPNMIECLSGAAMEGDHDIVVCGFTEFDANREVVATYRPDPKVICPNKQDANIFALTNSAPWNKLFKKSLFTSNNILFKEGIYHDDLATMPKLIFKAESIRFVGTDCYEYLQNPESISHRRSAQHVLDYFYAFDELKSFCTDEGIFQRYAIDFRKAVNANLHFHAAKALGSKGDRDDAIRYVRQLLLLRDGYLAGGGAALYCEPAELLERFTSRTVDPSPSDHSPT